MLDIRGSVAVITGGAQGIGRAIAEYWVAGGGKVLLADESEDRLEEAKKSLESLGGETFALACGVVSEADCARLARKAIELFGKINLVAPCAGITRDSLVLDTDENTGKVIGKMSLDHFQSVLNVNLTGVFLTVRECTEQMINHECRGLICLISSTSSLGAARQLNYASAKAALSVAPKVLTAEFFRRGLAGRIRCVAVAPGYVDTSVADGYVLGSGPILTEHLVSARSQREAGASMMIYNPYDMGRNHTGESVDQVPIGRLIDPYEVASLVGELYRNEALAGDVYYIHGGLRLGSSG
jgi:3-oxoacyl-[acyl-carrier protein] reductase